MKNQYYDRDPIAHDRGYEIIASRKKIDPTVVPHGRTLFSQSESPVVLALDVTRSMVMVPQILYDDMPEIAEELGEHQYLQDPEISIAAVGDITSDEAPLQVCDFSLIKNLDSWLTKLWIERGGGLYGAQESYEFLAYFYAKKVKIPRAATPIFIFIADEGFREKLSATDLRSHFGGSHKDIDAKTVFEELKTKFNGNVFCIRCFYASGPNKDIVDQWQEALGENRVIELESNLAVADVILGIFAIIGGKRTLVQYLEDMRIRGEDEARIQGTARSLAVLDPTFPIKLVPRSRPGPIVQDDTKEDVSFAQGQDKPKIIHIKESAWDVFDSESPDPQSRTEEIVEKRKGESEETVPRVPPHKKGSTWEI